MALPRGYHCITLDETDSTNAEALRRIAGGAGPGMVIRAQSQTGGRGRRGRSWESPPGNLYASIVLSCPANGGQLAFAVGLAAADALAPYAAIRLKWPNDLLLDGRKLGGVLIEASGGLAVVGVGINLVSAPEGTEFPATCLTAAGGRAPEAADLLEGLYVAMDRWHATWIREGFSPLRAAWLKLAVGLDEPVTVRLSAETLEGRFTGLDEDGGLMLETADGGCRRIAAGDVFFPAGSK